MSSCTKLQGSGDCLRDHNCSLIYSPPIFYSNGTVVTSHEERSTKEPFTLQRCSYSAREAENNRSTSKYIFANPKTNKPYGCIFHAWDIARKQAGFPNLRIHDLRHSFASALVNQGVSLYEVQYLLGHNSIRSTQRYSHLDNQRLLKSVEHVSKYFS